MTFFYDLNKRLDSIRATPEVTNKQLNEQASPLTQVLNERATGDYSAVKAAAGKDIGKPGKNFGKIAAGAAKRYGSEEAGKRVAGAVLNKLRHPKEGIAEGSGESVSFGEMINVVDEHEPKYYAELSVSEISDEQFKHKIISTYNKIIKQERMRNDFNARMERESAGMDESALQAAFGKKKYGDQGMKALQQAGRNNASDNTMSKIRNRYDKYDESMMADEGNEFSGNRADAVAQHKDSFEVDGKQYPVKEGGIPMTPKQQKFAKLAKPFDKITFADKIVGAKKEVDEMLGQVAADAMKKAVRGRDQDMEEASTGNAFDYKNFKQPEKQKPTSFVHKGTYGTEYDGDKEDAKAIRTKKQAAVAAGQGSRGRGRPKNNASADTGEVMKPDFSAFGDKVKLKPHAGKITKHKMVGENDIDPEDQGEYDQEGRMAKDDIKTVVRHAQALQKVLGDNDNLPEWVQAKLAKIEGMMTAVDDYMQNQQDDSMDMDSEEETIDERSVSKAQVKTMGAAAHNPKFAKKVGIKPGVAKEFNQADKGKDNSKLPEKAPKKKKEVDETTSSGSVSTGGSAAPKSSGGMSYGKGIYDSLNRELEGMISESMNINMSMNNDSHGGPTRSLTVTATDDDAMALASMLRMAGMGGGNDHMPHMNNGVVQPDDVKIIDFDDGTDDLAAELSNELHGGHDSDHSDTCPTCGSSDCGCDNSDTMDEAYGDTDATENEPNWPTDAEGTDDAMMYSGGIDGPKSTGQSTIPVIASQQDRQHAYEDTAALRRMMEMAGVDSKDKYEKLNEIGLNLMQPRTNFTYQGPAGYNDNANADAMSAKYDAYIEKYEQELEQLKASPTATTPGTVRAISSLEQSIKGLRAERLHNVMAAIPDDATNALRKQAIANNELTPGQWLQKATQYFKGKITGQPQPGVSYDRKDTSKQTEKGWITPTPYVPPAPVAAPAPVKESNDDTEFSEGIQRMQEMAGLPVSEAAPPVKLATPQAVDEPVSPASAAATPGKKPVVKPVTKLATPQDVPEPVKEDQMAQSLMRELHNFKY